jgi:inorganic pyrophosphatase
MEHRTAEPTQLSSLIHMHFRACNIDAFSPRRYNINWNYGMLPQTWEDPSHANPEVNNTLGDNDPGKQPSVSSRTS